MKMQDNEFDKLFRSKLDDLETEPSENVWPGIVDGLNKGKRRRILAPLLGIAASIIVLISAGILFIPQKITIVKHQIKPEIAKTVRHENQVLIAKSDVKHDVQKPNGEENKRVKPVNNIAKVNPAKVINTKPADAGNQAVKKEQPVKQEEQTLASLPQKPDVKEVVPGNETALSVKPTPVEETTAFITKPVLATNTLPVPGKQIATVSVKPKHRIRSLGDLINVVVAKVDKRKDKVIEFTNTDEDEPTITGVNLGIIKIKKDQ